MSSCARTALVLSLLVPAALGQSIDGRSPIAPGRPAPPTPDLVPGQEYAKPGGGSFFADANQGGRAGGLNLVALVWGRVVDVHGLDANGAVDPRPVFHDYVVNPNVQSDGAKYVLVTSLATGRERLVVLRRPGAPEPSPGAGTFASLLAQAEQGLTPVQPFNSTFIARNAVLMARFDDLLFDRPQAELDLFDNVRLFAGEASASTPFAARLRFDPNHGGIARGKFHSTRVLIDLSISTFEAGTMPVAQPINVTGLPASRAGVVTNARVVIPTVVDPGSGQFTVLTNLGGKALFGSGLGQPVQRLLRSGNGDDANRGFLFDPTPPAVVGAFSAAVDGALDDPAGEPGFDFLVDWTFDGACGLRPVQGNALVSGGHRLEVVENGPAIGPGGQVLGVRVHLEDPDPIAAGALLGAGQVLSVFRPSGLDPACWVQFLPAPLSLPDAEVDPSSVALVRFSESMEPSSVSALESVRILRGAPGTPADATSVVVAEAVGDADLMRFALEPLLPLQHVQGTASPYHLAYTTLATDRVTDLAGNGLLVVPPPAGFTLDPAAPTQASGGVVLNFSSTDELAPAGAADLRGAFFFDLTSGRILPRPASFTSATVDAANPVTSLMIPFVPGVQTPLSPLGSKLHQVWRYADLGWSVRDETKYDVDVVGLNWSPAGGAVISDFFDGFEIRLAHSRRLPDEDIDQNLLPKVPTSGVLGAPNLFTDNILVDPLSPQKTVHPRSLGYVVNPADRFFSTSGTALMPYPLNQGATPLQSYTWRDTSVLASGGPNGTGVPMGVEVGAPLFLEPVAGELFPSGEVRSVALPLLMEYRCYPSDVGLGLNALNVSLAINSSALPAFRAYSTGGVNTSGQVVLKDPDTELVPSGNFNPVSTPPGQPSNFTHDDMVYIGQLDLVTRVSRALSQWIDLGPGSSFDVQGLVVEGDPAANQPDGRQIVLEFRGALGFTGGTAGDEFNAARIDCYGEIDGRSPQFLHSATWSADRDQLDGARFVQLRITFVNDVVAGTSPALDALGLAYRP